MGKDIEQGIDKFLEEEVQEKMKELKNWAIKTELSVELPQIDELSFLLERHQAIASLLYKNTSQIYNLSSAIKFILK